MLSQKIKRESYGDHFTGFSGSVEIDAFGLTEKGVRHTENEDAFLICETCKNYGASNHAHPEWLLAVSDGFGNGLPGRTAGSMAIETLRNSVLMPSLNQPAKRLVLGMEIANQRVFEAAKNDKALKGMATTLTVVLINEETAFVASVGNSRTYLIRDGQIMQLTKDHTLAQQLTEFSGKKDDRISKAAHKTLLKAIGNTPFVDPWQCAVDLLASDLILVCSDGLTAHLTDGEIRKILEENGDKPERAVQLLVKEANDLGGDDNITAIVAKISHAARKSVPLGAETDVELPRFFTAAA